jgi:hypothetical protein
MRVRINESREHSGAREIDDLRAGRILRVRPHTHNLVALNHDGLIGERLASFHIEQVASVNNNRFRRRRSLRPGNAGAEKSNNKPTHVTTKLHSIPQKVICLGGLRYNLGEENGKSVRV